MVGSAQAPVDAGSPAAFVRRYGGTAIDVNAREYLIALPSRLSPHPAYDTVGLTVSVAVAIDHAEDPV